MTEKISITRALVMLKTLDKRIQKYTSELKPLDVQVDKKLQASKQTLDDFTKTTKSEFQQVVDLIAQRDRIKSGVVKSNALTTVTVGSTKLTVAQAIERKASIEFEKTLLTILRGRLSAMIGHVDNINNQVKSRLDNLLVSTFSKDSTKVKPEEFEAVAKPFLDRNEASMVDPLNIRAEIERLEKSISAFEEDVDVALSESNAQTLIEI